MARSALREPLEDTDLAFGAGKLLAFFIDSFVIVGKTILKAKIRVSIFPYVNRQIAAGLRVVFDENCVAIGRIATKEASPDAIAAVNTLKIGETIL